MENSVKMLSLLSVKHGFAMLGAERVWLQEVEAICLDKITFNTWPPIYSFSATGSCSSLVLFPFCSSHCCLSSDTLGPLQ